MVLRVITGVRAPGPSQKKEKKSIQTNEKARVGEACFRVPVGVGMGMEESPRVPADDLSASGRVTRRKSERQLGDRIWGLLKTASHVLGLRGYSPPGSQGIAPMAGSTAQPFTKH